MNWYEKSKERFKSVPKAAWMLPNRNIIVLGDMDAVIHISYVINNPEKFNITKDELQSIDPKLVWTNPDYYSQILKLALGKGAIKLNILPRIPPILIAHGFQKFVDSNEAQLITFSIENKINTIEKYYLNENLEEMGRKFIDLSEEYSYAKNKTNLYKLSRKITEEDVRDPNCPPEILTEVLKRGKNDDISCYAAVNKKCPPDALAEVLRRGKDDLVSWYAARNQNCSPEILTEVLRRGKSDAVSCVAAKNPKCPPNILTEVLRRGNDDVVSRRAAENPNCPQTAIIQWKMATGQIEREDPAIHDIDYGDQPKEDPDLKKFKELLESKSFNLKLYKKSQQEITLEMVKDPNCSPEILTEVLKRGKNDDISCYAAINKKCPPDVLAEVLRRGQDDWVSRSAAHNPKCSPDTLAEVLRRGNDDPISQLAAQNINCHPDALAEVLRRGNDDGVSHNAAHNPKCPPEILTEVLRRGNDDEVSQYAAINPKCPPEILAEVLRRGKDDDVSYCAAQNPKCHPEILTEVLRRGNDDRISWEAARNPNVDPQEAIKWKMATGQIQVEDPSIHDIDYGDQPKEDPDLKKFKELLEGK